MLVSASLFIVLFFGNPLGSQMNVFFAKTGDLFADFFNCQRYIAENNPYFNEINGPGEKCYLPLSYLILGLFNGFADYPSMSLTDCYSNHSAMMSAILFMLISIGLFFHSFSCFLKGNKNQSMLVVALSSVFLFTIERGTLTLLVSALILYFLSYKDSHEREKRVFSLLCLCVASVVKVYPVLFGLFLLREKRYRDIGFCVIASLILTFLPFLVFENGFANIPKLISNLQINTDSYSPSRLFPRYGIASTLYPFVKILKFSEGSIDIMFLCARIFTIVLSIISIALFLLSRTSWKSLALITFTLIMFPTNSALYCGMYAIPLIFSFLEKDKIEKGDYLYMIGMCMILIPVQIVLRDISVFYLISNMAIIIMWLSIIVTESKQLIQQKCAKVSLGCKGEITRVEVC